MEKIDARKHSPKTQYEIRKQVIRLRKKGIVNTEVADGLGISATRASTIWQQYVKQGLSGIKLKERGRRQGEKRTLSKEQETEIQKALIDKNPRQFKLNFALWTRDAVRLLVKKKYRIDMPYEPLVNTSSDGDSLLKNLQSVHTNKNQRQFKSGLMMNIHLLLPVQKKKTPKYTGVMKPVFKKMPTMQKASPLKAKPPWCEFMQKGAGSI